MRPKSRGASYHNVFRVAVLITRMRQNCNHRVIIIIIIIAIRRLIVPPPASLIKFNLGHKLNIIIYNNILFI